MDKLIIGSHVSFKKDDQIVGSIKQALSYGANTFMFYTGAPQNTKREKINLELVEEGKKLMEENGIDYNNVVIHAPYIINFANANNMDFNIHFLKEEIKRVEELGFNKLVLHPGSHVGIGIEQGLKNIIESLNYVLESDNSVDICLETMAGKGTELATSFEQIKEIIDGCNNSHVKVCLDTCHLNDAGYDLNDFDKVLSDFDKIIGLDKLACIHVNDSKNVIGAHKDRHENIGFGTIGFDNLIKIIYHPLLANIPKILETPFVDSDTKSRVYAPYKEEIQMIKNKKFNDNLINEIKNKS